MNHTGHWPVGRDALADEMARRLPDPSDHTPAKLLQIHWNNREFKQKSTNKLKLSDKIYTPRFIDEHYYA